MKDAMFFGMAIVLALLAVLMLAGCDLVVSLPVAAATNAVGADVTDKAINRWEPSQCKQLTGCPVEHMPPHMGAAGEQLDAAGKPLDDVAP